MKITNHKIILGSNSPRRQKILSDLGIPFEIRISKQQETYPLHFSRTNISEHLAKQKARNLQNTLKKNELLITADTIVIKDKIILNKPRTTKDAKNMLQLISGNSHEVITSVCLTSKNKQEIFSDITLVYFSDLSKKIIEHYIKKYNPFDKAGSYGIQDWIGLVSIKRIEGSYTNVVGLPSSKLFDKIRNF